MCLAQRHNAVTVVRLEPVAPRSRLKHSTTEPRENALKTLEPHGMFCIPMHVNIGCVSGTKTAYAAASPVPQAYANHMTGDGYS